MRWVFLAFAFVLSAGCATSPEPSSEPEIHVEESETGGEAAGEETETEQDESTEQADTDICSDATNLVSDDGRSTVDALRCAGELDSSHASSTRALNAATLHLVEVSEGWVPNLYNDPAGHCTIGHGHLVKRNECDATVPHVYNDGITEAAGTALLDVDLNDAKAAVDTYISVPLTDNQYGALVDFTYNLGAGNLRSSKLRKKVNNQEFEQVGYQLRRWVKAGSTFLPGLYYRRDREANLFYEGSLHTDLYRENADLLPPRPVPPCQPGSCPPPPTEDELAYETFQQLINDPIDVNTGEVDVE